MTRRQAGLALAITLAAPACAGAPSPADQLASAEASMRAAKELKAERNPQAELHLQLASEQVKHARQLMKDGDNEESARLLKRARADADLAIALSKEAKAEQECDAMSNRSRSASANETPINQTASASR